MSKLKQVIEIDQPKGLSTRIEGLESPPENCNYCSGRGGWFIDSYSLAYNPDEGEVYKTCPICSGTGCIQAKIIINWQPCGEVKDMFKDNEKIKL